MGGYVAIPHYGLFDWIWEYDGVATVVPVLAFAIASIALSYVA